MPSPVIEVLNQITSRIEALVPSGTPRFRRMPFQQKSTSFGSASHRNFYFEMRSQEVSSPSGRDRTEMKVLFDLILVHKGQIGSQASGLEAQLNDAQLINDDVNQIWNVWVNQTSWERDDETGDTKITFSCECLVNDVVG